MAECLTKRVFKRDGRINNPFRDVETVATCVNMIIQEAIGGGALSVSRFPQYQLDSVQLIARALIKPLIKPSHDPMVWRGELPHCILSEAFLGEACQQRLG